MTTRHATEPHVEALVRRALAEDLGPGDRTTEWTVPPETAGAGRIVAKAPLVVAGVAPTLAVFAAVDEDLSVTPGRGDGDATVAGDVILELRGPLRSILTAERTALNFLQRLSGIATLTRRFVEALDGTGTRVVDTRKTTPGWRRLEKDAVRAGGGDNHRMGLYDMVLVKENHIAAAGGLDRAMAAVAAGNGQGLPVEVEVRDVEEFRRALAFEVDRIMLDNMSLDDMRRCVALARDAGDGAPLLEASGNVTLARVRDIAATGVDLVSVGALTHSAPAADVSLLLDATPGGGR